MYISSRVGVETSSQICKDATLHVFEAKWLMSGANLIAICAVFIGHICLTRYLMNKYFFPPRAVMRDEDDYERQEYGLGDSSGEEGDDGRRSDGGVEGAERQVEEDQGFVDFEKRKELMKLLLKCFLHNLDMYTDIYYILYVPMFSPTVKKYMIAFIILPVAILFTYIACQKGSLTAIKSSLLTLFGAFQLYEFYKGTSTDASKLQIDFQNMLFLVEDGPQFYL